MLPVQNVPSPVGQVAHVCGLLTVYSYVCILNATDGKPLHFRSCVHKCVLHNTGACRTDVNELSMKGFLFACRAPELFEVPSNCTITAKTDVWSLGCPLYAAAFGETALLAP